MREEIVHCRLQDAHRSAGGENPISKFNNRLAPGDWKTSIPNSEIRLLPTNFLTFDTCMNIYCDCTGLCYFWIRYCCNWPHELPCCTNGNICQSTCWLTFLKKGNLISLFNIVFFSIFSTSWNLLVFARIMVCVCENGFLFLLLKNKNFNPLMP